MTMNFLKYHGGKGRLINKILPYIPDHKLYIEPFLGGGSILLNKSRAETEVVYDINRNLIKLWKALQSGQLEEEIQGIEYSEENFNLALNGHFSPCVNEFILYRMSRGGLKKSFSWSDRLRGGIPGDVNAWNNCIAKLPILRRRIKDVKINWLDWSNIINYREKTTFVYIDPPYVHSTRTKTFYDYELDESAHEQILNYFSSTRTKVMLSGYDNDLYRKVIGPPNISFNVPNNSGQSKVKQRRIECIWMNYK